ncbi:MAG: hypothetical protein JWO56_3589 [Acidobacteria bacterium]|nr:hypothetical protein [Acidobacteriota bacterium]
MKGPEDDPLDREIDFSKGRPNPFAADFYKFRNVVILDPFVLDHFPDSDAVNHGAARAHREARQNGQTLRQYRERPSQEAMNLTLPLDAGALTA